MDPYPRSGAFSSSRRLAIAAMAVAAGVTIAACQNCTEEAPAASLTPGPSFLSSLPEDPAAAQRRTIEQAYQRFWEISRGVDQLPQDQWRPALEQVAVDPILTQLVEGTRIHRDHSIRLYGQVFAHVTDVQVKSDQAEVRDCQDASQAGQADANTGMRKTVGIARNPVKGSLVRDATGTWRVGLIEYPGGTC